MKGEIECEHQCSVDVDYILEDQAHNTEPPSAETTTIATKPVKCCIGVDKNTGRVKWCPDCEFIKYLLILPIILLPIIISLILLMRISSDFTGGILIHPITERVKMSVDLEPYHRQTRSTADLIAKLNLDCRALRHVHSESFDVHEKEILRDVRTSFIPSGICLQHRRNVTSRIFKKKLESIDDENELVDHLAYEHSDQIDFNHLIDDYGKSMASKLRERRNTDENQSGTNESVTEMENFETKVMNDVQLEEEDRPYEIPAVLKTFWKGGKTYDQIRNSQVEIMKQYMDTSVKPCEDFYSYACGW